MGEFQIAGNDSAIFFLQHSLEEACEDADELAKHMHVTAEEIQSVQERTEEIASGKAKPQNRRDGAVIYLDLAKRVAERTLPELFGEDAQAAAVAAVLVQALLKKAAALFLGIELSDIKFEREARSLLARQAANALHSKPGGSRSKADAVRAAWASGKYSSRDICAEQECAGLDMSFSAARKALRNTPNPT
mgnify:CR=1 FL=1